MEAMEAAEEMLHAAPPLSTEMLYGKVTWKYQLKRDVVFKTNIKGAACTVPGYIYLRQDGILIVKAGYACDGPSGPLPLGGIFGFDGTIDTEDFMAAAVLHDALYQLMRTRKLGQEWRLQADIELDLYCKGADMGVVRRWYVKKSLRKFAGFAARPGKDATYVAPVKRAS